jgi:hypothetical protein
MKKNLTILSVVLITLISLKTKAQDEVSTKAKNYISLFGGLSNPLSNFSSTNYSNNSAGYAKKGVTIGLDGADYFYKNLAFAVTFSYQDQGELNYTDVQNLSNSYNVSFGKNQTTITAVNRYQNINLMGGPQYSFLYKKFTIDLRASAGFVKSISTPSLAIVFDYSTNTNATLNQLSSSALAFAYGGSVGLRYSLGDSWDIGLKANYINSDGIKIENSNNTGTVGRFVTKQPITEIQTTLGITLKF